MKKVLFIAFMALLSVGCTNDEKALGVEEKEFVLPVTSAKLFENRLKEIVDTSYPIIYRAKTRAVDAGQPKDMFLNYGDSVCLAKQSNELIEASKEMFYSMGLTNSDLKEIFGEGHNEAMIPVAIICMSYANDRNVNTRALPVTGNLYMDCALTVLGIDAITLIENGATKAALKKLGKAALKRLSSALGGPGLLAAAMAVEYTLCVANGK